MSPVSRKTVKLIYDYVLKCFFSAVCNHALKGRSVIAFAGEGAVNVFVYDYITILFRKSITFQQLSLDALLILSVT